MIPINNSSGVMSKWTSRLPSAVLVVVLVMPLFYYPVANSLLPPLMSNLNLKLDGQARTLVAVTLGALVLASLAVALLVNRPRFQSQCQKWLLLAPETWALVILLWFSILGLIYPQPTTLQNLVVYSVAAGILLLTNFATVRIYRLLPFISISITLVLITVGASGLFIGDSAKLFFGSNPRLYATYCILALCLLFAIRMTYSFRLLLILGLYGSIVISNSRAALITGLIVACIGLIVMATRPWLATMWIICVGTAILISSMLLPHIRSHNAIGATTSAGMPIEDSGRLTVWKFVYQSFLDNPLIGQGLDRAKLLQGIRSGP